MSTGDTRLLLLKKRWLRDTHSETPKLSSKRLAQLRKLESALEYSFKQPEILEQALTHKSFSYEAKGLVPHYEPLEFLGDAILGLIVGEHLLLSGIGKDEGHLSKLRAYLVSAPRLTVLSRRCGLHEFLQLGRGEDKTGGRNKAALQADLFESVVAAIYLDGGFQVVRQFVLDALSPFLQDTEKLELVVRDYKSALQEQLHRHGYPEPSYVLIESSGPDHAKEFVIEVCCRLACSRGKGSSKKEAEQAAAQTALRSIRESKDSIDLPA